MYLLEALTAAMCNSHEFFVEVQDHYKNEERKCGVDTAHPVGAFLQSLRITRWLFGTMKAMSVDPAMIFFRLQRGFAHSHMRLREARKLLREKKINFVEYRLLSPLHKKGLEHILALIRMNIYEAGVTEYGNGLTDNAFCAHFLSESIRRNPPQTQVKKGPVLPRYAKGNFYRGIIERGNRFPTIEFSQDWASLYGAWNITFALNEGVDFDLIAPKLLMPSVIDARPDHYICTRAIALWLTLNYGFFRRCEKRVLKGPKNNMEMARTWAAINKKYALQLSAPETHETATELISSFRAFFSHPIFHFFGLMKRL